MWTGLQVPYSLDNESTETTSLMMFQFCFYPKRPERFGCAQISKTNIWHAAISAACATDAAPVAKVAGVPHL